MTPSRSLPTLSSTTFEDMAAWFAAMAAERLLFHPDDDPSSVFRVDDGSATFSRSEATSLKQTLDSLFASHEDRVYEAALPQFMAALRYPD